MSSLNPVFFTTIEGQRKFKKVPSCWLLSCLLAAALVSSWLRVCWELAQLVWLEHVQCGPQSCRSLLTIYRRPPAFSVIKAVFGFLCIHLLGDCSCSFKQTPIFLSVSCTEMPQWCMLSRVQMKVCSQFFSKQRNLWIPGSRNSFGLTVEAADPMAVSHHSFSGDPPCCFDSLENHLKWLWCHGEPRSSLHVGDSVVVKNDSMKERWTLNKFLHQSFWA